jgi:pimeloyl-ACP methyl ester carboxylesterase
LVSRRAAFFAENQRQPVKNILFTLLVISGLTPPAASQTTRLDELCQVFHLPNGTDTTTFVVFGTKADLLIKKPLFLFRQGSRPRPFIELDKGKYYLSAPFRFREYKDKYHFVMIQKPGVRLVADSAFLAGYEPAMSQPTEAYVSKKYRQNNYLERYVGQCNQVINYLIKQSFIDARKVVYCGGSEGFTVGADLAANHNRALTHVILFSGGTWNRRFESMILEVRQQIGRGELSPEAGQQEIDNLYKYWAELCANPTSMDTPAGDTNRSWYSFSVRSMDNLLKINVPLYIAYGTADEKMARGCDALPLEFIAAGKKNLTLRAWHDHDHIFYRMKRDATGKIIDKTYNGDAVAKAWMDWLEK